MIDAIGVLHDDPEFDSDDADDGALGGSLVRSAPNLRAATDAAPSTLPQIIHLAHKNGGQFLLDRLRYRLSGVSEPRRSSEADFHYTVETLDEVLKYFAEALRKDETDSDLWRRTARIAGALGKKRLARLCLETVLTRGRGGEFGWQDPAELGIDEKFALEQLRQVGNRSFFLHCLYKP